jgi:hypothetical protein
VWSGVEAIAARLADGVSLSGQEVHRLLAELRLKPIENIVMLAA